MKVSHHAAVGNDLRLRPRIRTQGDLEHIFDKFYRAQKTDQVRAGTGLGLAISRGFVEAMHGTIDAGNRTDRSGAVLTIRLPIPAARQKLDTDA